MAGMPTHAALDGNVFRIFVSSPEFGLSIEWVRGSHLWFPSSTKNCDKSWNAKKTKSL